MLLVAAALEEELQTGMALCQGPRRTSRSVGLWQASRSDKTICFLKTGVGPKRSAANLAETLKLVEATHILVVGYAGALDPCLKVGDLVAVSKASAFSLDQDHPDWNHVRLDGTFDLTDSGTLESVAKAAGLSAASGNALTSPYVLGNPAHKHLLHDKFHALIVDMETAALAGVAVSNAIPISCIRVISDEVEDAFLAPFSYDPSAGIPVRAKKLLDTVQTYRKWRKNSSIAKESLSRFLARYL